MFGLIAAIGSLVIGVGSSIAGHIAQNKQSAANEAAALAKMHETWKDLSLQEVQQQDAASLTIMQADRQARQAEGEARVSSGEAGVAGASVDALISGIGADAARADHVTQENLGMTIDQIQREKYAASLDAQNQINQVPRANPFLTALKIGAAGIDFATSRIAQKPNA